MVDAEVVGRAPTTLPQPPGIPFDQLRRNPWESMARIRAVALTKPRNAEELYLWAWLILGVKLPRKIVSGLPGAKTPFDLFHDLAFDQVEDVLVMAARGSYKTLTIAMYLVYACVFFDELEAIAFGAVKHQSKRCYEYVSRFLRRTGRDYPWYLDLGSATLKDAGIFGAVMNGPVVTSHLIEETKFTNGSTLQILSGTPAAVSGPHPQVTSADEVELWNWPTLQDFIGMADGGVHGYMPKRILLSVRKSHTGTMQKLIDQREEMGLQLYQWNIFDAMKSCETELGGCEYGRCQLWESCQGRALHADGQKPRDEVVRLRRLTATDKATWESQFLCTKPASRGVVYDTFDPLIHVSSRAEYQPDLGPIYMAVDFGYNHPYIILFAQDCAEELRIFDCLCVQHKQTSEVRRMVVDGMWPTDLNDLRYSEHERSFLKFVEGVEEPLICGNVGMAVYDPSRPDLADEWMSTGSSDGVMLPGFEMRPASDRGILPGIKEVRKLLMVEGGKTGIVIHPRCLRLIWELSVGYTYSIDRSTGEVSTESPTKLHNDACDALRYLVVELREPGPRIS